MLATTSVPTAGAAKQTGRAFLAVSLLLGVYVLALGILFAWGYAIYLIVAFGTVTNSVAQLALLGLIVAIAIGRGIFASIRSYRSVAVGVLVSPEQKPSFGKLSGISPPKWAYGRPTRFE